RPQRNQSLVPVTGDGENSLSMRWVKLGSTGCMNHADGAGGGRHVAATGWILGKEDWQPDISSSKLVTQASLVALGIG
ncbi:hypothetical protein, partial [Mycoplasmopsis synoviae]|uniref:hypothetical protein n=1 Tax=Mycoplasmopsis synoviae TaxID=2109 RepID=UPI003F5CE31B